MSDKNINVYFAVYEPYENLPAHTAQLGNISNEGLEQLMSAIENYTPDDKNSCISGLSANYTANVACGRVPMANKGRRECSLELTDMFWLSDRTIPPCVSRMKPNAPEGQRMYMCARHMAAGKCRDEFMRCTIGAVLFPQFYANEKSK